MPSDLIFVYGTLRSGFSNEHALLLRANAEFVGPATVRGSIYLMADYPVGGYPGFRENPDGVVHGEIWRLREPERILALLDAYEGDQYERVRIGDWWIYRYIGPVAEERRIQSGDFLKSAAT